MNLVEFLNPNNKKYQLKVIVPTHTYGTVYNLDSKYNFEVNFDEYDKNSDWEYYIEIDGEFITSFESIEDAQEFIQKNKFF